MIVGAEELALNIHHDNRRLTHAPSQYFPPLFDGGDIAQPNHRRAVLIRDDKPAVFVGELHLIVSEASPPVRGHPDCPFAELTLAPAKFTVPDRFAGRNRARRLSIQFLRGLRRRFNRRLKRHQSDAGDTADLLRHAGFTTMSSTGHPACV
ncbi:hypothetical protein KCP73_22340 [Salmonella enterica subsp. enterica]|nr:hypothetical protein KCP73_22340 [Salmonella enterica subsp. enterica]